jgi:DnaK suppressor protein
MAPKKQGPASKKQGTARKRQTTIQKKNAVAPKQKTAAAKQKATARTKQATAGKKRVSTQRKKPVSRLNRYRPTEGETFMNNRMTEYFRGKLLQWRTDLLEESSETLVHLQESSTAEPDLADRASLETDRSLELRTRDRERKLLAKIDAALARIEEGTYGYCEETMEPIAIRRLEARPIATLSIEAQERHERMERTHREE